MDGARCLGVSCLMALVAGSGVPEIGCYQFRNQGSDPSYVSFVYFDTEYRSVKLFFDHDHLYPLDQSVRIFVVQIKYPIVPNRP